MEKFDIAGQVGVVYVLYYVFVYVFLAPSTDESTEKRVLLNLTIVPELRQLVFSDGLLPRICDCVEKSRGTSVLISSGSELRKR